MARYARWALVPLFLAVSAIPALGCGRGPAPGGDSIAPEAGLTASGRLLFEFESLLRHRYGRDTIFMTPTSANVEVCALSPCGPADKSYSFFYTFEGRPQSNLALGSRLPAHAFFGNLAVPVLLDREPVRCGRAPDDFLVRYADAISFSLACQSAQVAPGL